MLNVKVMDTNDKDLEELQFENYQEAEDYVYGKYDSCWHIEKESNSYTFIVYAE